MISLTPLAVAVRGLVVRPAARSGVDGLSRLAAPTRSPWFWVALWTASAAASFAALVPVLFGTGPEMPLHEVLHACSGAWFAVCGLVAWRRRADSAVGPMLTVTGFGVLVPEILAQVDSPVAVTLVLLFGELWIMFYAALILSFTTGGRLTSRVDVFSSRPSSWACSSCRAPYSCSCPTTTTFCSSGRTPASRMRSPGSSSASSPSRRSGSSR
jgi:hypothetical protein